MGCICSKGSRARKFLESNHVKAKTSKKSAANVKKDNNVVVEVADVVGSNENTSRLVSNHSAIVVANPVSSDIGDIGEKNAVAAAIVKQSSKSQFNRQTSNQVGANVGSVQPSMSRITSISNGERGAQIIAGWPSWLTAVAGEAINGWVPRKSDSFEKLDKIGQGTYSSVYRARDLETNKIVALKKVRFTNMDPESVRFMAREIIILRRLDHPNVMKLEGLITSKVSGSIYLVFEYMDHDLAGIAATPGIKFTESQIKCYMKQLFNGLEHCHERGVMHRDIKGANLLIDYDGNLKIGDFGLATFFRPAQKQPLTSRVVTLWYRPPELLLGSTDYGVSVDLWSSGCILAELFNGKPIMPGRTEVEQLHKIFKLCGSPSEEYWKKSKLPHSTIFKPQHPYKRCVSETFKDIPSSALALLEVILAVEPECRGTASSALQNEFFTSKPLPCDPSSLPKYAPSKEFDAKIREDEARRRKGAGCKGRGSDSKKSSKESKAVRPLDPNADLQASVKLMQKQLRQSKPVSISEKFGAEEDNGTSGFPIGSHKGTSQNVYTQQNTKPKDDEALTGPVRKELRTQRSCVNRGTSELSRFSNSASVRSNSHFESTREAIVNRHWPEDRFVADGGGGESSGKYDDWSQDNLKSSHKKDVAPARKESVRHKNKKRIHYSGPLLPNGGNLEEMLKQHERQIQQAVRKARTDKTKTKTKTGVLNGR